MPKLRIGSKGDSNPESLDCVSGVLPLSYGAPQDILSTAKKRKRHSKIKLPLPDHSSFVVGGGGGGGGGGWAPEKRTSQTTFMNGRGGGLARRGPCQESRIRKNGGMLCGDLRCSAQGYDPGDWLPDQ